MSHSVLAVFGQKNLASYSKHCTVISLKKKQEMNIYLWVLLTDKSCHLCLLRWRLCIQYLQVCVLHIVICCIWSRSLVCDCSRLKCCQTSAALKLQDKQQSFDDVPLLTSNSAETLRSMIHFAWKTLRCTEMSDLATALSAILSTLLKVILHLVQWNHPALSGRKP